MAFCNKLSGLLRPSVSQSNAPAMLNSLHRMFSTQVFVGGFYSTITEQQLTEAFSSYGEITEARIIRSKGDGRSRGFGFINFADRKAADAAVAALHNEELYGREVSVKINDDQKSSPRFGGGGHRDFGGKGGFDDGSN